MADARKWASSIWSFAGNLLQTSAEEPGVLPTSEVQKMVPDTRPPVVRKRKSLSWNIFVSTNAIAVDACSTGYPNLGAFLDSDESFRIYRQFGYLQSRLLLEKQDELRRLEERLDEIDKEDDLEAESRARLKTRDLAPEYAAERKEMFGTIEKKFLEYGKSI